EEEPEWLSAFQERMQTEKADVVFGQQVRRKGKLGEQVTGGIFYKVFNALSATKLPVNFVTARLMSFAYVKALLEYRERELFFGGLVMMSLGVIVIYLAKVLIEVKQRPAYTIRAVYRADESSRTSSNNQAFRK